MRQLTWVELHLTHSNFNFGISLEFRHGTWKLIEIQQNASQRLINEELTWPTDATTGDEDFNAQSRQQQNKTERNL